MNWNCFIVATLLLTTISHANGENCKTQDGDDGSCVKIYSCSTYLKLAYKYEMDKSVETLNLLRNLTCGFEGVTPKVCCPTLCLSPKNEQGKCTQKQLCDHLNTEHESERCTESGSVCCVPRFTPMAYKRCRDPASPFPPNPYSKCCGISGGGLWRLDTSTQIDDHPWLSLIEYQTNDGLKLQCQGLLISGKYVLAAAHCMVGRVLMEGKPVSVRLGEFDTATEHDCKELPEGFGLLDCLTSNETMSIPIESFIVHPEYNHELRRNDIALIRLKKLVSRTDFIRPICLPTIDYTVSSNLTLTEAGWDIRGSDASTTGNSAAATTKDTRYLNLIKLDLLPRCSQECQKIYKSLPNNSVTSWDGQFCAKMATAQKHCSDSLEGPLMYQSRLTSNYEAIGLISRESPPCSADRTPAVYTKIYEYNEWIYSNIAV